MMISQIRIQIYVGIAAIISLSRDIFLTFANHIQQKLFVFRVCVSRAVAELDLEFQTNEGGHSFATVMNSSYFTIHVMGIFIGQGGPRPPLAPMKLRPWHS